MTTDHLLAQDRELYAFQRAFIAAVDGKVNNIDNAGLASAMAALACQPGFKVYRNTILKAGVDALAANFPSVLRLVGEDWFRAAALVHVSATPPDNVCLIDYGSGFADFLAGFAPAAGLPYLGAVAQLDRCWSECHLAADEQALDASALANLAHDALLRSVLRVRAAVRWRWYETQPAYQIWRASRQQEEIDDTLDWQGEGALLSRIDGQVCWRQASAGMCAFLDACAAGADLQQAAGAALQRESGLDIALMLSQLIQAEAFAAGVITSSS